MNRSTDVSMKMFRFFKASIFFLYLRIWFLWSSRKIARSRCSSIDKSVELIASILIVKKIEKSSSIDSIDSILIRFTYRSTSSRWIIVLTIMIHLSQSSNFFRITFVFCDAVELMIKDIFDIVLIRRLIEQQRDNEAKVFEIMIQSINKKLWVIEGSNASRTHNCRILLTDERMNCYCCLFKMNEKFSLLYRKSFSFIYLLIFHLLIHRDSSENRNLHLSRRFFLLIKLSSFFVVTSIWFHQNRIFIFELIDLSTILKISKFERNHLDWMIVKRLDAKSTNWWKIDDTNRLK